MRSYRAITAAALGVMLLAGCGPSAEEEAAERAAEQALAAELDAARAELMRSEVLYEVEGVDPMGVPYGADNPGSFDLTAETPGGTQQASPDLPLQTKSGDIGIRYEFNAGDFVYVSAQLKDYGSITCRITVDGEVISEVTSQGQYSIASCDGTA